MLCCVCTVSLFVGVPLCTLSMRTWFWVSLGLVSVVFVVEINKIMNEILKITISVLIQGPRLVELFSNTLPDPMRESYF